MCPAGTRGIDPQRRNCSVCPAGYYCPHATGLDAESAGFSCNATRILAIPYAQADGTIAQTTYQCPCEPGFFCPMGSASATGCPAGTFGVESRQVNASSCVKCGEGSYNAFEGQTSCHPCGTSAVTSADAASCDCKGQNRVWSAADGQCICRSGYIFYDATDRKVTEKDDSRDCIPSTAPRCTGSEFLFASRQCVDPSDAATVARLCTPQCGTADNVAGLDTTLGICSCKSYTLASEVCNSTCQAALPTISCLGDGVFSVTDPRGPTPTTTTVHCPAMAGACSSGSQTHTVAFGGSTIEGVFADAASFSAVCNGARRRRRSNFGLASIPNPLVCVQLGSTITFELDVNNRNSFPVYNKDNLLNSNPSFDYGAFRNLRDVMLTTNLSVAFFSFTFTSPGIYVFADNSNMQMEMYVQVMASGVACPAGTLQPSSVSALVFAGATKGSPSQEPNWTTIAAILGAAGGLVFVLVVAILVWRPAAWRLRNAAPVAIDHSSVGSGAGEEASGRVVLLEDFNVKTLYSLLQKYEQRVQTQVGEQGAAIRELHERLLGQTDALRVMVENLDLSAVIRRGSTVSTVNGAAASFSLEQQEELMLTVQALLAHMRTQGTLPAGGAAAAAGYNGMAGGADFAMNGGVGMGGAAGLGGMGANTRAGAAGPAMVSVPLAAVHGSAAASEAETACRAHTENALAEEAPRVEAQLLEIEQQRDAQLSQIVSQSGLAHQSDIRAASETLAAQIVAAMDQLDDTQTANAAELAEQLAERRAELAGTTGLGNTAAEAVMMVGVTHDVAAHIATEAMLQAEEQARLAEAAFTESERHAQQLRDTLITQLNSVVGEGEGVAITSVSDRHAQRQRQMRDTMRHKMAERKARRLSRLDGMHTQELEVEMAAFERNTEIATEHRDAARQALREKIGMRQRAQRAAAVTQMDAEENKAISLVMDDMVKQEIAEMEETAQIHVRRALHVKYNPDEAERIMNAFDANTRAAEDRQTAERDQGKKELQARLEAIRKRKQMEQQRKAADDAAALVIASENSTAEGTLLVPVVDISAVQHEIDALQRNQKQKEIDMQAEHAQQLEEMRERAEQEIEAEQRQAEQAFALKRQQILREREQRLAADRAARTGLTSDESDRLLKQHAQELEALEGKLNAEQHRSQVAIKDRLQARKRQREEQLLKQQETEVCRKQLEEGRERAEMVSEQLRIAENEAIVVGLQQNKNAPAAELVQLVLAQRHALELQELEQQHAVEKEIAINDAMAQLAEKHNKHRARLEAIHRDEQAELLEDVGGLSAEQLDDKRAELLNRQHAELRDQSKHFDEERSRAEADAVALLSVQYAEQRVQLTERQYQDIILALQRLGTEAFAANTAQAQAAAADLERVRVRLEEQNAAERERMEAEQKALEEAEDARVAAALRVLDEQLAEQRRLDQEARVAQIEEEKQKLIEERRKKRLQVGSSNEDEKKKAILKQFDEDTTRLVNAKEAEKNRQEKSLEMTLRLRGEKRRAAQEQKVRSMSSQRSPVASSSDLAQVVQQATALTAPAIERIRRASLVIERRRSIDSMNLAASPLSPRQGLAPRQALHDVPEGDRPVSEDEMLRTLGASTMLARLEKIEALLAALVAGGERATTAAAPSH